jgi:hypothetical protein
MAKILQDYQEETENEYRSFPEYKDRLSEARRKSRAKNFNQIF